MHKKILFGIILVMSICFFATANDNWWESTGTFTTPSKNAGPKVEYNYNFGFPINNNVYNKQQNSGPAPQFNQFNKGPTQTLADLPSGTLVLDPNSIWHYREPIFGDNYSGKIVASFPVIWIKLANNHYSKDSTLLLSKASIANYPFCMQGKDMRDWGTSDLRKFLNSVFYKHLSQNFKNHIVSTTIPYADISGKPQTATDHIFALSIVEWGLSDRAHNGKAIDYYNLREIMASDLINSYENDVLEKLVGKESSVTRTINRPKATSAGHDSDIFMVSYDAELYTTGHNSNNSVRPALNLKSTIKVKGPYTQKGAFSNGVKNNFEYYVLDFPQLAAKQ